MAHENLTHLPLVIFASLPKLKFPIYGKSSSFLVSLTVNTLSASDNSKCLKKVELPYMNDIHINLFEEY